MNMTRFALLECDTQEMIPHTLTFAFDSQLTDNEDYVKAGTVVEIVDLDRHKGFTGVRVTEAYDYNGNQIEVNDVCWFSNSSFIELR